MPLSQPIRCKTETKRVLVNGVSRASVSFFFCGGSLGLGWFSFYDQWLVQKTRATLNQSANQNEIATCLVEDCSNRALCVNFTISLAFFKWKNSSELSRLSSFHFISRRKYKEAENRGAYCQVTVNGKDNTWRSCSAKYRVRDAFIRSTETVRL